MRKKKVVVVGGGTGTYQTLTGLKNYPSLQLSAVISMCDSGGSTGRLRKELGILPPGDVRRAILALSDLPFAQKTLEEVFDFRFKGGKGLVGHSLGNILLAALTQITGSMDSAINEAARILNASGKVFPVTLDKTNLVAVLEDGTRIHGETKIDRRRVKPKIPIKRVYLNPQASVFKEAARQLAQADLVVLGPGDLYTSIVPTLLVDGVNKAIVGSRARVVYVVNLLTKKGETDGFVASDFVRVIEQYLGASSKKLAVVLANKGINQTKSKIASWYRRYGSAPVLNDLKDGNYKVVTANFSDTTTFYRHSPQKLAKAIVGLL
ncbi:hypothetical protein A2115_02475 [Candidatus Woesebacteria bacterium GWA1_41_8]|uniref:Putative gluconeogenesis factor n=1 Tax=Candidatus Woesebacteria bacterium GWA1_41_8 TaxID=1802471 RepID=A0A1F7WJ12_9BACT|nr:MAG: hypothetical protein A2115_02475 [Candidatus Woesebacteria bacterium GWA1_41_8]